MDVFVAEFRDDNTYSLYDQWSADYSQPANDVALGGKYDFSNLQYNYVNGLRTLSFERKLNTGDKFAEIIR